MKKKILIGVALVLFIAPAIFSFRLYLLGHESQSGRPPGIVSGQLTKCPNKPNCFNSEFPQDQTHYIEPIAIVPEIKINRQYLLKKIIKGQGGKVNISKENYIAATFTSERFKFVDDLEIRLDKNNNLIHLRSGSRVGYGDMGVNEKRIKSVIQAYTEKIAPYKAKLKARTQ